MAEASHTSSANAAQTLTPTKASVEVDLRPFSELKTRFKKLDVDRTGSIAALANSKVLLVYDLENMDKHQNFIPYKSQLQHVNAVRWNPHHHCRMHLASAKGRDVILWRLEDAAATGVTGETILRKHTSDVSDISWSQQEEHLLVSASHSIFCWDTRAQSPVQEWKVPGVLTSHVSFNRKNAHLLASSFQNQVCIWDLRKVQKPVLTILAHFPKDTVTSLDWSHESEYNLLTSGGGVIKLWSVGTAAAKQLPSQANPSVDGEGAFSVLQHKHVWRQPMQKVLFAPVGQAAITSSRGFFEEKHESQTIKMWSLVPAQRFRMVNTFEAGRARIMGLSWRPTADGGYQVASLDDADYLRLYDLEEPHHRSAGVDLPAGDSSTWRDYGSTAGSESLEGVSTSKAPALRDDIVPVVWSFSKLQSAATSKMMIETAGDDPLRELMQVEKIANRGGFGSTSNVHVDAAQKSISLVMLASAEARRQPSANESKHVGSRGGSDAGVTDAHAPTALESDMIKYVAAARLRMTARLSQGHRSRDEHAGIQLESDEGYVLVTPSDPSSTTHRQDPLDEAALKRMQAAAGEIMHQAVKSRQPRLQACLNKLRENLEERVRDVANHLAGVVPGDELKDQQAKLQLDFDRDTRAIAPDFLAEGGARDMTPAAEMAMASPDEPIVPCPRRFGATFAPNGSLVVFCSALAVVRARTDDGRKSGGGSTRKQASSAYPRTYTSLLDCLQKAQRMDMEEDSQGDHGHHSRLDEEIRDHENRSWFRSSWGYAPEHVWEGQDDGTFDVERYSTEESFVEEDGEAPTLRAQDDSTRLPISHPDHSLGAGLGAQSDNDAVDRETDEDTTVATDAGVDGELPWTPKPKEVVLVDCSRFLPGSVYLAAFYKLGPLRPPVWLKEGRLAVAESPALGHRKDTAEDKVGMLFGPLTVDSSTRADFGAGSDMSVSSGGRSRRNSLVFGSSLGISTGLPPPLSIIQRGVSATQDSAGRGGGVLTRRPSVDLAQNAPGLSRQKQWESSPDFKTMRAGARSTGSGLRGPWVAPGGGPGASMVVGSPGFVSGSPGRWEVAKARRGMGSRTSNVDEGLGGRPHPRHQASELADVAEFPLREPGVNVTPPRSQALKEDGPVFSLAGGAVGGGDAGMFSPGAGLARKPATQHRNMHLTRKGSAKMRQNYPLPRSPCSSCGPSPPVDTPRLRLGGLNPASPKDPTGPASSSPPMSDFGMDLGHTSVPAIQIASNAAPPLGRGSRSSSFCAGGGGGGGASLGFGEFGGGDGINPGLPGLSVRGHQSGPGDPDALHVSGNRSRSGTDLWRGGTPTATVDEGEAPDFRPSIGHLSRHNAAVATVSGRGELASFWALMADAADKGAEGEAATGKMGSRCFPSWKSTGPRLTATILGHFETRRDPQMLASIACVLGSGSRDSGAAVENTQEEEEEKTATYDRYLACYAERLYQWGAQGVMAEATSHQTGAFGHRSALQIPTRQRRHGMVPYLCEQGGDEQQPHGPFHCSVCYKPVDGEHLSCRLCGHGGHSTHIE
ncbi:unnamed protein product, partial [Laminaria digitata]